jgi:hypothetical protein
MVEEFECTRRGQVASPQLEFAKWPILAFNQTMNAPLPERAKSDKNFSSWRNSHELP